MVKLKNSLKEENVKLKNEQEEAERRHKKLREKFRQTKHELEECLRLQSEQHTELEAARERIDVRIYFAFQFLGTCMLSLHLFLVTNFAIHGNL